MSEKQDPSISNQQQKEKKANNKGVKHSKKTHKKDWQKNKRGHRTKLLMRQPIFHFIRKV